LRHDVRGSTAGATTDFQHPFAGQIHLCRRDAVKLDAVAIGLVSCRQRQAHRRILFVAKVEKHHVIPDLASAERQEMLRSQLADDRIGLQAASEGHGEEESRTNVEANTPYSRGFKGHFVEQV
jgi:hypothetical protein